jgi:hypothetical protein
MKRKDLLAVSIRFSINFVFADPISRRSPFLLCCCTQGARSRRAIREGLSWLRVRGHLGVLFRVRNYNLGYLSSLEFVVSFVKSEPDPVLCPPGIVLFDYLGEVGWIDRQCRYVFRRHVALRNGEGVGGA